MQKDPMEEYIFNLLRHSSAYMLADMVVNQEMLINKLQKRITELEREREYGW